MYIGFRVSVWLGSRETTAKFKGGREHFGENIIKDTVQRTFCLMERQLSLRTVLLPSKRKTQLSAGHPLIQVSERACCPLTAQVTSPCMAALAFTLWCKITLPSL